MRIQVVIVLLLAALLSSCARESSQPVSAAPASAPAASTPVAPTVEVVNVAEQKMDRTIRLPAELAPYQSVAMYPRVAGFVERVSVDRGSRVKRGQLLARLSAPEMASQRAETEARMQALRAQRAEAEAKLAGDESTYQKLKRASETPGVVAGNDVLLAQKAMESSRARVQALQSSEKAARAAVQSTEQMEAYLRVTAPFDGIVTERNVHPGTLVAPSGAGAVPMLRVEQVSRLRLVVAVPEVDAAGIADGGPVEFTVPAYPAEVFSGIVRRSAHSLDPKTRTMPVELDVTNSAGKLAPGMFADVKWPVRRTRPSLFVPPSAIVTTTERTFVIRIRDNRAQWVDVRRGSPAGDLIEVFGDLKPNDQVVKRASDELRAGTAVKVKG